MMFTEVHLLAVWSSRLPEQRHEQEGGLNTGGDDGNTQGGNAEPTAGPTAPSPEVAGPP